MSSVSEIIGIALVRNEDIFVERALRNTIDFCDRLIVADHQSTDGTLGDPRAACRRVSA